MSTSLHLPLPLTRLSLPQGVDELPAESVQMVKQATDTPEVARTTMTAVTFVLGAVLILIGAVVFLTRFRRSRRATATLNSAGNGKPVEMADVNPTNGGTNGVKVAEAGAPPTV